MGLDIHIGANNYKELHSEDYYNEANNYFNRHSLSRTFCNLMCRQNVISHEPELDQIGRITGADILPLYEMESYPEAEGLDFALEFADSDEERERILNDAKEAEAELEGNIDKVLNTIKALIDSLNAIDNLPALLLPTSFNSLNSKKYFADFQS